MFGVCILSVWRICFHLFLVAPWTSRGRKNRIMRFLRFGLACKKCILCNYCSCSVDDSCILLVVPDNSLYTSDLDDSLFEDEGEKILKIYGCD